MRGQRLEKIKLSNHCFDKMKNEGHSIEDIKHYTFYSLWKDNLEYKCDGTPLLRVDKLKGKLVMSKDLLTAITFLSNNQVEGADGKKLMGKNDPKEHRYNQRYECSEDLSKHFSQGDYARMKLVGDTIEITKDGGILVATATKCYDSGYGSTWTTALGKILLDRMEDDKWFIEVNASADKHGRRLKVIDESNNYIGRLKTVEDYEYRKLNGLNN